MENPICDTAEDVEYKKAVREFYRIYNSLKKKRALRMHGYSDLKSTLIEIWEYRNNGEIKTIFRVKAENSSECHKIAADFLKRSSKQR